MKWSPWMFCWDASRTVGPIDAVLCIADASNIERNLFLVSQVLDLGLPSVLVLNMCDVARQRKARSTCRRFSERLGDCRHSHRGRTGRIGIDEVRQAIVAASESPAPHRAPLFPRQFYEECAEPFRELRGQTAKPCQVTLSKDWLLDVDGHVEKSLSAKGAQGLGERLGSGARAAGTVRFPGPHGRSQSALRGHPHFVGRRGAASSVRARDSSATASTTC